MTVTETPLILMDEGSALGRIKSLNFVGPNIEAVRIGNRGKIYASKYRPIDDIVTHPPSYIVLRGAEKLVTNIGTPLGVIKGSDVQMATDDIVYDPDTGEINISNDGIYVCTVSSTVRVSQGGGSNDICYSLWDHTAFGVYLSLWKYVNYPNAIGASQYFRCASTSWVYCLGPSAGLVANLGMAVKIQSGNSLAVAMVFNEYTLRPTAWTSYTISIIRAPLYYVAGA